MRAKLQTALERLRALPWYFRLLVRISLLSLYALGPAITLCYWLTVGFVTEAWPWVLWGETYLQIAEQMRTTGRPITYFLLLVIGWWLLGLVIEPPWKIKRPSLRLALLGPRVVYATVIALCLAAVLPLLVVNSVRVVRTWPPRTNHLLLENCGHCHSPYRPQHYIKSADMWQRTVRRMIERNGAPVSDEKAEKIIAWLQDYRGFSDSWMFR
ncbi:MAG: hypothetical protein VX498_03925, partial [Myxococcota bacterium]|nr:hypothetical protein [Myxococcota bacterium]